MENFEQGSPFHGMCINSHQPLLQIKGRFRCPGCQRSVRYFCYHCLILEPVLSGMGDPHHRRLIPLVTLPLDLLIIKHRQELPGKSTAIHACLLAPQQSELVLFHPDDQASQERLQGLDPQQSILLFPDATASSVESIEWTQVKRVIVLDGTWTQAKSMARSPALKHLSHRHVKLDEQHASLFWRYQQLGPHCLSTIEAIYHFYRELLSCTNSYQGSPNQLDNLLYFFSFFYSRIQEEYKANPNRTYTSRHRDGYIKKS